MSDKSKKSVRAQADQVSRDKVIRTLCRVLQEGNSVLQCCAIRGLVCMRAEDVKTHERLIDALLDPDPDVRVDAAEALGLLKVESAVNPLLANIEGDPEGDVRITAVKALGEIGSAAVVDGLIRCVQKNGYPELDLVVDDDGFSACWEVQRSALDALGKIGDERATDPVVELLTDEDNEEIQESGFQLLARLDSERAEKFLVEQLHNGERLARRRAAQAMTTLPSKRTVDAAIPAELLNALNDALVDPDPSVRLYAAQALKASNNPMVLVPLTLLLNDPEQEVRHGVASLLGEMRGPGIVDRLHDLLQQTEPKLKHRLVRVLGDIADPASCQPLHELLSNCDPVKDHHLLHETIVALGEIGKLGPGEDLAQILSNPDMHHTLRLQAAQALGRIYRTAPADQEEGIDLPKVEVEQALTQAVYDDSERVGYAAITALSEIDQAQAIDLLVKLLRSGVPAVDQDLESENVAREECAEGTAGEVPIAMQEMLSGHNPATSTLAAILAQPSVGLDTDEKARKTESRATKDNAKRILAARLLGNIPDPGTQVITALSEAGASSDPALRKEAILSLGRIGHPDSAGIVLGGLSAKQSDVRLASLDALENFTNLEEINERLAGLFSDPDPYIRERVINLLDCSQGKKAKACLVQALQDKERNVCTAALSRLSEHVGNEKAAIRAAELMFEFGGELRIQAAAALRRMNDYRSSVHLYDMLQDNEREEAHWICIDALTEMYAQDGVDTQRPSEARHDEPVH